MTRTKDQPIVSMWHQFGQKLMAARRAQPVKLATDQGRAHLGIAQGALDQAVRYTSEREQFGETLSRFQMIRGKIADMATEIEAGRALLYNAAQSIDAGDPKARALASMAKLFCSDVAMRVTTEAVQLHGGAGYLADFPVERMMRDAKITQIYEGVNEIQRLIIAKHVYG